MRLKDNQKPLIGPYFLNASKAYCEQVGVKRHLDAPSIGESIH
jgi:hypothetical protein